MKLFTTRPACVAVLVAVAFAAWRPDLVALAQDRSSGDVANGKRVYLADGNQYFNRPGPRIVESVEILAEIFLPTVFDFGHKDKAWQNL